MNVEIYNKNFKTLLCQLVPIDTLNYYFFFFLLSVAPIYQGSPQRMFSNIRTEDLTAFYARMPFLMQPTDSRET